MRGGHTEGSFYFIGGDFEHFGKFFGTWFALEFLFKLAERLVDFVERANFVQRQSHNTALLGQGLEDALTNPPNGIRNELETTGFVKTLCGFDKAQVAFVDKVRQAKSLIQMCIRDRNRLQLGCKRWDRDR